MYNSEDEDIAKAIALSLQESSTRQQPAESEPTEVITISDDEDEGDDEERRFQAELQRAIEASKQEEARHKPTSPAASESPPPQLTQTQTATSFLSERAQLERERLARQKRLRPEVDVETPDADDGHRAKRQHLSPFPHQTRRTDYDASSSATTSARPNNSTSGQAGPSQNTAAGHMFWDGEVRQTANAHVDPATNKYPLFLLSEILAPRDEIEFAIVSSYVYDYPWLYSMFSPTTPVIAVAQDQSGEETIKAILPNWIKTTPFLRNGMGCMHMKFMLLFYKSRRLRVAISTANMIQHDWRDIENTVWVQDVLRRSAPIAHDPKAEDFPTAMGRVLRALNVPAALVSHLRNDHPNLPLQRIEELRTHYDFSKVKARLVPSIAGKHESWPKVVLTGHTALMKVLRDMGAMAEKGKELVLECQGSSIGTYSTQWVNEFYCSARGESAQTWLDAPKSRRAKLPYPPIKILFPTLQYVRESVLGERGGGTMFCRRNQWEGAKFPRELFHQSRSKRGGILMHSKMILGLFGAKSGTSGNGSSSETEESETESETEEDVPSALIGWIYVGSHNFTPSAWGTLSGSAFNPILNITNYELGIVLPLRSEKEADRIACWVRPPKKYNLSRDQPWIQSESPVCNAG
ncbi:hypothetical protein POSPLADRAFT_1060515 [Postia placenta MAD-698-R-SB12]|uniref:Phospholipase D/nuclease n=1 Tax=Postia placenta MAD-698-R-SB12 TaxID=670580 RepID=A0A1X6MQP7_9APHY|nr:hypothetical protein POSPLADRAFT_1060515 [Postia placenta MAD-698-R-SB12]OSX58620.1 hypothetical protein POSPLADRAFT_1060515 [Postia placenta MAD-698-R-SB12]